MTISPLALAAKKVIDAAWLHGDAYDLSSQAAFALESVQLLQSPETAAELVRLRARAAGELRSPLAWARLLDAKSLDNFLIALGMAVDIDPVDGALSQVEEMIRSFRSALPAGVEEEREQTLHDHVVARDGEVERLKARVAELEAAPSTVFRASHDSIVMGLYTTAAAAREHCETLIHREQPDADLNWYPDTTEGDDEDTPEGLFMVVAGEESDTGYVVTPLTVASEYDGEADE